MTLARRIAAGMFKRRLAAPRVSDTAPALTPAPRRVFDDVREDIAPRSPAPSVSSPPEPRPPAQGTCRAINAETGRQCALPSNHVGAHAHGRTMFIRVAAPGQTHFTSRALLDAAATSHPNSTVTP